MKGYYVVQTIPEAVLQLPKKEQQEAAWAVMVYGATGELPEDLSPVVRALLTFICPTIEMTNKKAEANRENGKLGGRPKKAQDGETNNPSETQEQTQVETQGESEAKPTKNPIKTQTETHEKPTENPNSGSVTSGIALGLDFGLPLSPTPPNPYKIQVTSECYTPQTPQNPNETQVPNLDEVVTLAKGLGIPSAEAKKFFNYYKAQGWKFGNGSPITDLSAALQRWTNSGVGKSKHFEGERKYAEEQLAAMTGNADNFDEF